MSRKLKILLFSTFSIIALIIVGFDIFHIYQSNRETSKTLKDRNQQIAKLNLEITKTENELQKILDNYDENIEQRGSVLLCFSNITDAVYSSVYNSFNQSGYQGTMIFTDGTVPGDPNKIDTERFGEMIQNGWSFAIGMSGEWNAEYMSRYKEDFLDRTGYSANAVYFAEGLYSNAYDEEIKNLGFNVILYLQEEESDPELPLFEDAEGIYKVRLSAYRNENVSNHIDKCIEQNAAAGFLTTMSWRSRAIPEETYQYSDYGISEFLWPLNDRINSGELQIISTDGLISFISQRKDAIVAAESNYREQIDTYEKSLEDLREKKDELFKFKK